MVGFLQMYLKTIIKFTKSNAWIILNWPHVEYCNSVWSLLSFHSRWNKQEDWSHAEKSGHLRLTPCCYQHDLYAAYRKLCSTNTCMQNDNNTWRPEIWTAWVQNEKRPTDNALQNRQEPYWHPPPPQHTHIHTLICGVKLKVCPILVLHVCVGVCVGVCVCERERCRTVL